MKKLIIHILLISSLNCVGQNQFWKNNISIRRSFETQDDKSKPASLFVNWPKENKSYYLINAGISLSFDKVTHLDNNNSQRLGSSIFYVRNRNNQIDKVQNTHKAGIALDFKRGWTRIDTTAQSHATRSYVKFSVTGQYLKTKIPKDTSNSFASSIYFTWLRKWQRFVLNDYIDFGNSGIQLFLGPSVGLEYQQKYNAKNDSINGGTARFCYAGVLKLGYKQKPSPERKRKLGYRVAELSFKYTSRNELANSSLLKEGITNLFVADFSIFPFAKSIQDNLSIGISYSKGEDPFAGLQKQQFWQLAFKFKK